MPVANNEAMSLHLKEISKKTQLGRHAIVIMDQAGWHKSKDLIQLSNVTPVFLPPCSPELNPVEQVWQQLRNRSLANRCYKGYQEIVTACVNAWNEFTNIDNCIKNLCTRSWAVLCN